MATTRKQSLVMNLLYLMATLAQISNGQDCEYGSWGDVHGVCMFTCADGTAKSTAQSTLSFDFIRSQCADVNRAYEAGICNSSDDLVFRNACTCPYCKCSTSNQWYIEQFSYEPSKACYDCTCKMHHPTFQKLTIKYLHAHH